MTLSLLKKDDYLNGFIVKRVSRIYVPFFIATNIIGLLYNLMFSGRYSLLTILVNAFTLRTVYTGEPLWYVVITIFFYVIFYLAFKIFKDKRIAIALLFCAAIAYIIVLRYLGFGSWWYNTSFGFPVGAFVAYNKKKITGFIDT